MQRSFGKPWNCFYSSLLPHSFSLALSIFFVSSLCSEVHLVDEGDSSLWCIMAPALSAMLGSGAVGSEVAGAAWLAKGELALVGTLTGLTAFLLLSVLLLLCASCQGWVTFFETSLKNVLYKQVFFMNIVLLFRTYRPFWEQMSQLRPGPSLTGRKVLTILGAPSFRILGAPTQPTQGPPIPQLRPWLRHCSCAHIAVA